MIFSATDGLTLLHDIADTTGKIISIPILILIIQGVRYIDSIKSTATNTAKEITDFIKTCNDRLCDLEKDNDDLKKKMHTIWDGHERRKNHSERAD